MNQNRKCCILVDDAFVRSPLGIIKFVSTMVVKHLNYSVSSALTGYNGSDQENFDNENLGIDSKSL